MSYRRRSSKSTSAKIIMFIVCILIITIGVLKYLKSQDEDFSAIVDDTPTSVQLPSIVTSENPVAESGMNPLPVAKPGMNPLPVAKPGMNPLPVAKPGMNPLPVAKPEMNPLPVAKPGMNPLPVAKPGMNPLPVAKPETNNATVKGSMQLRNKELDNIQKENSSLKLDALSQDKEIVIKNGDSLWQICFKEYKNGSYCNKILEYNKSQYHNIIDPKHLKTNSVIYLPPISYFKTESKQMAKTQVSKVTKTQTKTQTQVSKQYKPQAKKANDKIYEIQSGDTFSSISLKEYQTSIYANAILNYNNSIYHLNLNEKKLQIKTTIYLPPKEYFANNDTIHIVKENETLDKISIQHYNTYKYAKALQKYNHIKDSSKLQINQEILIPSLATIEKMETGKSINRESKRKSNSDKIDLEKLSNYQLICVKKSTNTWDSLAKYYQISKRKLIECNNRLYELYPKIIPETSQIKIPIQVTQRKSL